MLKVKVKGATNLPDVDKFSGKSDPYAIVSFQGRNINSNDHKCPRPLVLCHVVVIGAQFQCEGLVGFWYLRVFF